MGTEWLPCLSRYQKGDEFESLPLIVFVHLARFLSIFGTVEQTDAIGYIDGWLCCEFNLTSKTNPDQKVNAETACFVV